MEDKDCMTVEEVEKHFCSKCADDGHWGWCDAPWIKCTHKSRIKEILGVKDNRYSSIRTQMKDMGIDIDQINSRRK